MAQNPAPTTPPRANKGGGVGLILGGIAVFVVCSIIQGAGGTSMFSQSFESTDNAFMDLLLQITWWPGWIASIGLIVIGVRTLVQSRK
jgi:hypothetical protein